MFVLNPFVRRLSLPILSLVDLGGLFHPVRIQAFCWIRIRIQKSDLSLVYIQKEETQLLLYVLNS